MADESFRSGLTRAELNQLYISRGCELLAIEPDSNKPPLKAIFCGNCTRHGEIPPRSYSSVKTSNHPCYKCCIHARTMKKPKEIAFEKTGASINTITEFYNVFGMDIVPGQEGVDDAIMDTVIEFSCRVCGQKIAKQFEFFMTDPHCRFCYADEKKVTTTDARLDKLRGMVAEPKDIDIWNGGACELIGAVKEVAPGKTKAVEKITFRCSCVARTETTLTNDEFFFRKKRCAACTGPYRAHIRAQG